MQNIRDLEEYVKNNDIQFIRLCFFDVFGAQRAITIMPQELRRAVEDGISFDAAAIPGFAGEFRSDLFLEPDFDTMTILPWSSFEGSVLRVLCDITYPDRTPFERDSRHLLKQAVKAAEDAGITVDCGTEVEFYIFQTDEEGRPTRIPHDDARYFAVSPADRGENIRREICRMLYDMGIIPEAAHHEQGPGQHEVDFRYGDPLQTADNTTAFKWVVENAVQLSGCAADFSPKPLRDQPGNGMHLNISARSESGEDVLPYFMAGVLAHIREMTLFLNPLKESYDRLTGQICSLLEAKLGIPGNAVYVTYHPVSDWGWNGKNF